VSTAILRTAAGASATILSGRLSMPAEGAWTAHLQLGEDAAPPDGTAVTVELAREGASPVTWSGYVDHGDTWQGRQRILVVGGAGGLAQPIDRREHLAGSTPVPALAILQAILAAMPPGSVETLNSAAAGNLVGLGVARWDRAGGAPASRAVGRLARRLGLGWRVLDDGSVWMGPETWPAVDDQLVSFLLDRDGDFLADKCAPDAAVLRPGTTVMGRRIQRVTYTIGEGAPRAELLYRSDRADIAAAVRAVAQPDPLALVHEAVVAQPGEAPGTLDLQVDEPLLPELRSVRYRSMSGAAETFPAGATVLLAFTGGREDGAVCWGAQQDPAAAAAFALVGDSGGRLVQDPTTKLLYYIASGVPGPLGTYQLVAQHAGPPLASVPGTSIVLAGPGAKYAKGESG
jgi:hypothetical protein